MKRTIVYIILIAIGFFAVLSINFLSLPSKSEHFQPEASLLVPFLPPTTLSGQMVSIVGSPTKQSRQSTKFLTMTTTDQFLQGETIQTDSQSSLNVSFPSFVNLKVASLSSLALINASSENFLINQTSGTAGYQLVSTNHPLSVRASHLLIQLNSGRIQISVDGQKIIIKLINATVSLAYNDLSSTTNVKNFAGRKTITFDDISRTYFIR